MENQQTDSYPSNREIYLFNKLSFVCKIKKVKVSNSSEN